jgi:hypothetical protein
MSSVLKTNSSVGFRQRRLRRTNVYIAEYILMLFIFGGFIGILASMWYSFFGLLVADSFTGSLVMRTTVALIGMLVATGVLGYVLYARVTGEELHNPSVVHSKARTVFLTIWLFGAVLTVLGMIIAMVTGLVDVMFGTASDTTQTLVGTVAPALFAIATLCFGIWLIVKRSSRKLSMVAGMVLAGLAAILLLATTVTLLVRKNDFMPKNSTQKSTCADGMIRSSSGICKPDYTHDSYDSFDYKYNSYN